MGAAGHRPSHDDFSELGQEFARLATLLVPEPDEPLDQQRVGVLAARAVPDAEHCAVTFVHGKASPRTVASTGEVPRLVDALQYSTGQGPCLDALEADDVALVEDLATEERWPAFAGPCVARTGVRSMLAVRLSLGGQDRAALNFYASPPGRFTSLDVGVASMFAPFASLSVRALVDEERVASLEEALATSRQIGTAVGILMARELLTSEQAFDLLREASQHLNRKLRDVAAQVEMTGKLPDYGTGRPAGKPASGT